MICITWYEPTDYGFEEHHYVCDKLGAYEYDEVLFDIETNNYEYEIEEIEWLRDNTIIVNGPVELPD